MPSSKKRKQTWIVMSICVLAGLEALAMLTGDLADELDPVGELARAASKLGLIFLAVILLGTYIVRRRQAAAATRAKSRRRRHRRGYYRDDPVFAESLPTQEQSASHSAADL